MGAKGHKNIEFEIIDQPFDLVLSSLVEMLQEIQLLCDFDRLNF